MKICSNCNTAKTLDDFAKDKTSVDGYSYHCRECSNKRAKEYRRTRIGLLRHIYSHQITNSKERGHNPPRYTRDEFVERIVDTQEYNDYFDVWEANEYNKKYTPSIDRKDDSKGYSFDNIQILHWYVHNQLSCDRRKLGINNSSNKSIRQYDRDGNFIQEFFSIKEAHRITGTSDGAISSVAKGKRKTAGGFIWKYATDSLDKVGEFKNDCIVKIHQFDMDGNFIQEHDSIADAARAVGLKSSSNITSVAKGNKKSVGGFIWKYANEKEEIWHSKNEDDSRKKYERGYRDDVFKDMDFSAMCKYSQGDISKEEAEKESKERGWNQE